VSGRNRPATSETLGGQPQSDRRSASAANLHEITLLRLRALLARVRKDEANYRGYRDRYRAMATSFGFEGHMKWAEAMP
jgi:hypothetical protein